MRKTSIYLPDDLDAALARRAADDGLSKAEYIRRALAGVAERPKRPKPSIGIFSSTDGLSAATDMDKMMEGFGES